GRSTVTLRGSTLTGNRAVVRGGGLHAENVSRFDLEQSILWGNCAGTDDEAHLFDAASGATFTCSAVDSSGIGGPGSLGYVANNIFADPEFCSSEDCSAAPTSFGDYRLRPSSPCLAASSPCAIGIGARGEGCGLVDVPAPHVRVVAPLMLL